MSQAGGSCNPNVLSLMFNVQWKKVDGGNWLLLSFARVAAWCLLASCLSDCGLSCQALTCSCWYKLSWNISRYSVSKQMLLCVTVIITYFVQFKAVIKWLLPLFHCGVCESNPWRFLHSVWFDQMCICSKIQCIFQPWNHEMSLSPYQYPKDFEAHAKEKLDLPTPAFFYWSEWVSEEKKAKAKILVASSKNWFIKNQK